MPKIKSFTTQPFDHSTAFILSCGLKAMRAREIGQAEANALKDGSLAQKYKELIALGISINNGCYG